MKVKELKDIFNKELESLYSKEESQTILEYIFVDALGIPKLTILSRTQLELNTNQSEKVLSFLEELKKGTPIQHLLGTADFFGMRLKVTPDVLIPRQETEELVHWIIFKNIRGKKLRVLDVCTGSGCIALVLKEHLREAIVTAIDISENALDLAKENAKNLNLDITFKNIDALKLEEELKNESFDIIVSNPPYVPLSDKDSMPKNVLMYEPHLALFVPDETPLMFYQAIASYAKTCNPVILYFEIYEDFGNDLKNLLDSMGFKDIFIKKDLNGKDRMVECRYF